MLAKLSEVMALKRSRASQEINESKMFLRAIDDQILVIEASVSETKAGVVSDDTFGNKITNTLLFVKWRDMRIGDIRSLNAQKKDINMRLEAQEQRLKEILVKEDIINKNLEAEKFAVEQDHLEAESSARLEGWVGAQS